MKNNLHIIEQDNLYGLADVNNHEVVECIYDQIKPLKSGKFIVLKDKMAGILSNEGIILLHLKPVRLHYIKEIDVFKYKIDDKKTYFKFIDNQIVYLDIDTLYYNSNDRFFITRKGEITKIYDYNLNLIHTGFDIIEPNCFIVRNNRFYLGTKNGKWGAFKIKHVPEYGHVIIIKIEPQYNTHDEALQTLKHYIKTCKVSFISKKEILEKEFVFLSSTQTGFDIIEPTNFRLKSFRIYLGSRNERWGVFIIKHISEYGFVTIIKIDPQYSTSDEALKAFEKSKLGRRCIKEDAKEELAI